MPVTPTSEQPLGYQGLPGGSRGLKRAAGWFSLSPAFKRTSWTGQNIFRMELNMNLHHLSLNTKSRALYKVWYHQLGVSGTGTKNLYSGSGSAQNIWQEKSPRICNSLNWFKGVTFTYWIKIDRKNIFPNINSKIYEFCTFFPARYPVPALPEPKYKFLFPVPLTRYHQLNQGLFNELVPGLSPLLYCHCICKNIICVPRLLAV